MDIVHKKREARLGTACPFVAHSESKVLPKKKVHTYLYISGYNPFGRIQPAKP